MLHIEKRHLDIVEQILAKYPYVFYAFGSRVKGNPKKFSDLDICYLEEIPLNILSNIKEDFEESTLPFTVDFLNWNTCDDEFKKSIQNDLLKISPNKVDA